MSLTHVKIPLFDQLILLTENLVVHTFKISSMKFLYIQGWV